MPIYQYQCQACGHELEEMQKVGEPPHKKCPKCGQMTLNKKISAVGFQLKGSGWYVTDYAKQKKTAEEESSTKEETSKTENKTDSASKTETKTAEKKTNQSESTE
jgi:putative FmdB family regulatory protein